MEQQDIRELRVAEISHKEWSTLGPDETVEGAIKLFAESGISGAPVVDGGRLVGIVTEGDLISPDASLAEASTIMADKRVKILPVAEGDALQGVITRMDILTLHVLNPHR